MDKTAVRQIEHNLKLETEKVMEQCEASTDPVKRYQLTKAIIALELAVIELHNAVNYEGAKPCE